MGPAPRDGPARSSSTGSGCGSWIPRRGTRQRRAPHRRHGQGRRPGLHRPAQPRRPLDPRRAAPRAQGPPGRDHRDRRRRRQRLRAVRAAARTCSPSSSSTAASTAARRSTTTGTRWPRTSSATTARSASTSGPSSATRRSASMPSAGTTCPRTSGRSTACAGSCATRWRKAPSGSRAGSTIRRAASPRPRSWPRSRPRPAGPAASITAMSATRSATGISTRSARRSTSGGGRRAEPHHPLLPPRDAPGPAEPMLALVDDARAEGLDVTFDTYPSEWASTRLLIQLPLLDPGRRTGAAQGAAGRPDRARPVACRVRRPWRGLHGAGRLGGPPARGVHPTRAPALGVTHAWPR